MKFKILFLLPVAALALAIGLTNCSKEPVTTVPETPDTIASERGVCQVTYTVSGNAQLCGTQTNPDYCTFPPPVNANSFGVETVGAGQYTYTINTPSVIGVFNPGPGTLKVSIATGGGNVAFTLASGASRRYLVSDLCGLTQI
ncbi:MAG: hypothetical protein U0U46_10815 [Saprospiraceae bacterium]|nr:hypothetical protein [Saprospiraceae bacterium]